MRPEPVAPAREAYAYNDDELSLWTLAAILLRKRVVAALVSAAIVLVGVPYILLTGRQPTMYTASASIVPEGAAAPSGGGLAARLGLSAGGGGSGGLNFYSELITSRTLLGKLAGNRYLATTDSGTFERTVAEIAGAGTAPEAEQRSAAVSWLRGGLRTDPNSSTGVMQLTFTSRNAETSRRVLEDVIKAVQEYNITTRQTQAAIERRFVESRLAALQRELGAAESQLATFLQENRQYANSPELQLTYDRLARERALKESIVRTLAQSYEQARIEEVRNTPVISVFEVPETPLRPNPQPSLVSRALWVVVLAVILGIVTALVVALVQWSRMSASESYQEFHEAAQEVKRGFARVLPRRLRPSGG